MREAERSWEPGWHRWGTWRGLGLGESRRRFEGRQRQSRRQGSSRWMRGMWESCRWRPMKVGIARHERTAVTCVIICMLAEHTAEWGHRTLWPLPHLEPGMYPQWPGLKRNKTSVNPQLRIFCYFLHMVSLLHSSGWLFARECSQCFSSDEHSAISTEPSPHNENKQHKQRPPVWYLSSWALYNDTCCLASKKKKEKENGHQMMLCVSAPQKVLWLHQRHWV